MLRLLRARRSKFPLISPHGGGHLINRFIGPEEEKALRKKSAGREYAITNGDLSVFYRIADGTLSPLEGPMGEREFYRVLDEEVVERGGNKYAWSIPLALPIEKAKADMLAIGEMVSIKNEQEKVIGFLEISDMYYFDKEKYNLSVYGTSRLDHPGPRIINSDKRDYLLGGKIYVLQQPKDIWYAEYMLTPQESRKFFEGKAWERAVAFQTRNPLHRAHEYAMVYALEKLTKAGIYAGVILNPLVGETKGDDVPADVRMRTYEALIKNRLIGEGDKDQEFWNKMKYDLTDQIGLIGLDMRMFYAGPKEALMHAIYRQNSGFTDIIIGRRHADAPFDDGAQVWGDFDAQEKFSNLKGELLIRPFKVGTAAYFEGLEKVALEEEAAGKGYKKLEISGKELRRKIQACEMVDGRVMRQAVADILCAYYKENKSPK